MIFDFHLWHMNIEVYIISLVEHIIINWKKNEKKTQTLQYG